MEYRITKKKEIESSKWVGGETTQLAIFPEDASYLDREFTWRLSTATCNVDEASFSKLPDHDRILLVLEGEVVLAHEDVRVAKLGKLEQDSFDGGYRTRSFGKITDYNLMVRKGNKGTMTVMELSPENEKLVVETSDDLPMMTEAFYCVDGFATVKIGQRTVMLTPEEQLTVNFDRDDVPSLSVMGEGHLVRCSILYDYNRGEFDQIKVESAPATPSDFKECVFIANTQFRFSKYTNKRLKSIWYDEPLYDAIEKVNNFYITDIIYFVGLAAIVAFGAARFQGPMWLIAIAVWTLLHVAFIGPAIYFLAVPKPVSAHIKDIDKLTPYEQKIQQKRQNTNRRVEKILKRYKMSGRARYDEDGNRIDNFGRDEED